MDATKKTMKVYYKSTIFGYGDKKGDVKETHQVGNPEYCCDDMEGEYDDHINYGGEYGCLTPHLAFRGQGYGDAEYIEIRFCPFCGASFEFVEKERYKEIKKCKTVKETHCEYKTVKIEGDSNDVG